MFGCTIDSGGYHRLLAHLSGGQGDGRDVPAAAGQEVILYPRGTKGANMNEQLCPKCGSVKEGANADSG